jgi:chorismate dehydratase
MYNQVHFVKSGTSCILLFRNSYMKIRPVKIAAVSFINTVPLIAGLEKYQSLELFKAVPASLLTILKNRKADLALIPSIDYQLAKFDLRIIRAGAIGSLTHSLTVRIFSKKPIEQIKTLSCDTDSHTSVILSRIVLKDLYNVTPEIFRYTWSGGQINVDTDAVLLIGDKVVSAFPGQSASVLPYQLDLVEAWHKLSGLGFVFAVWACRPGFKADEIKITLQRALSVNLKNIDTLARRYAPLHHWPVDIARTYLSKNMFYKLDRGQLDALKLFYSYAHKYGLISRHKAIRFAD